MSAKSLLSTSLFFMCAASVPLRPAAPMADVSLAAAPGYDPHRWNDADKVRLNNNCYAYASNDIDTQVFGAMPGKRTRNMDAPPYFTSYLEYFRRIVVGAQADGMIYTGEKPASKPGYYRVVLMMHPDYKGYGFPYWHWLRQGPDGYWSGKDGNTPATDLDRLGHRIKDPAKAVFGFDDSVAQPVAYFLVPKGGLDVGDPGEPKTHVATRPAYKEPPVLVSEIVVVSAPRLTR